MIVLATVKGDVHDIGKNLVEIIFGNNGYRVINLGIKVPPEDLIAAYHTHKPDAFGLSGLLVKSAQQMVVTAQDLRAAGIDIPLFVGGAALTRKFTATRIAAEYGGLTLYAKDAMDGLDLANQLFSAVTREEWLDFVLASFRLEPTFAPFLSWARDRGLHAVAEVGGEGGHGIGTAVFQQVLGEPALLLGDRRVALEALGVDDRVVEPRLRAVVEEDAVEHLAPGRRQPERDVGDAENRLALG